MADEAPLRFRRIGGMKSSAEFREYVAGLGIEIPCDDAILAGDDSPLAEPVQAGRLNAGNRWTIQPMEGWDATVEGRPTDRTFRRWKRFGSSGAKLIWGGEATAVCPDGRGNPNQLMLTEDTRDDIARLREALIEEHVRATGSDAALVVGLQLTHSGRFARPTARGRQPRILYRHPILDRRLGIAADHPVLTDDEIRTVVRDSVGAARLARDAGFDFVDIKCCHGYLGHEFLSAHTRDGEYGGSFENRTRFLRDVVEGTRAEVPGIEMGVRASVFDTVPFRPDPERSSPARPGPGVPEPYEHLRPYRWGFGVSEENPTGPDLAEPVRFLELLRELDIRLVNVTAGSPYYNPHVQRPAAFAPSDGYAPPEDPLVGVARMMATTREIKRRFPDLIIVGSAYTYLQDFLPHVAQAAVGGGWVDCVGIGRMALSYPEMPRDALEGKPLDHRRICRTLSDCTTAPRSGLPSGCYPLDSFYGKSEDGERLKQAKCRRKESETQ